MDSATVDVKDSAMRDRSMDSAPVATMDRATVDVMDSTMERQINVCTAPQTARKGTQYGNHHGKDLSGHRNRI